MGDVISRSCRELFVDSGGVGMGVIVPERCREAVIGVSECPNTVTCVTCGA
jgi:hypothetical protein